MTIEVREVADIGRRRCRSSVRENPGPVSRLVKTAILNRDFGRERVRESLEEAGLAEVPRLEERLDLLATIAQLSPLLGLLGTILGFIKAFTNSIAPAVMLALHPLRAAELFGKGLTPLQFVQFWLPTHVFIAPTMQMVRSVDISGLSCAWRAGTLEKQPQGQATA